MKQFFVIALAAMTLTTCTRRPLEDEYKDTALIPVVIDWSLSGIDVGTIHRATVMLFPQDESKPLEYYLESSLTYREIAVPIGVYSVVVFNETINQNEWDGLRFVNTDNYWRFAAVGIEDEMKGWYTRSDVLPLIKNPEELAAWSLDHFEVTRQMVIDTRYTSHNAKGAQKVQQLATIVPDLTVVKPTPRFERVEITAKVTNLSASMQITGTINGFASGVYMVSGDKITVPSGANAFILGGRIYEDNKKDGTATRTFNIFGRPDNGLHTMYIDFLLVDGTMFPRQSYAAEQYLTTVSGIVTTHHIYVDGVLLPDLNVEGGISVEDWDEVNIIIKN